jgi:hypothetical protein
MLWLPMQDVDATQRAKGGDAEHAATARAAQKPSTQRQHAQHRSRAPLCQGAQQPGSTAEASDDYVAATARRQRESGAERAQLRATVATEQWAGTNSLSCTLTSSLLLARRRAACASRAAAADGQRAALPRMAAADCLGWHAELAGLPPVRQRNQGSMEAATTDDKGCGEDATAVGIHCHARRQPRSSCSTHQQAPVRPAPAGPSPRQRNQRCIERAVRRAVRIAVWSEPHHRSTQPGRSCGVSRTLTPWFCRTSCQVGGR